ncbi:NUDIX domain-containing protein, partial [Candidatus Woesebacteria bacterium]|nr:NUDIX domain-containing protein [Candidatus Woesebacteria bacterium]
MSKLQSMGVCAILVNSPGKVLVGKRKNSYKSGSYGFPGGRIEFNEPILTAITREVEEETGLTVVNFQYVGVVRETQEELEFIHFVYSADVGDAVPELCEADKCEGWEWHSVEDLPETTLPGHRTAAQLFLNHELIA